MKIKEGEYHAQPDTSAINKQAPPKQEHTHTRKEKKTHKLQRTVGLEQAIVEQTQRAAGVLHTRLHVVPLVLLGLNHCR